jgi:hypothetical protein
MSNNDKGSLIVIIILSTAMVISGMLNSKVKHELKTEVEKLKTENARLNKLITKQNTDVCLANQILELSETKKNVIFISCD